MQFIIVTGMSGAGKSTTLKTMEDMGFFCVDNLPVGLMVGFAEMLKNGTSGIENAALGLDIRSGEALSELPQILEKLKDIGLEYKILFLDANDDVLVMRYKETRRSHPLARLGQIEDGIAREREQIAFLRKSSDMIIDTTNLLTRELKAELDRIFVHNGSFSNFIVSVKSFGFKYGIPRDADLVFDVRFLPNPFYVRDLKPLTGNDLPVREYVMASKEAEIFIDKVVDMLTFLIPNYIKEGKNQLVIGIGCTGGKHRSVTIANEIYEELSKLSYTVKCYHRDIELDSRRR